MLTEDNEINLETNEAHQNAAPVASTAATTTATTTATAATAAVSQPPQKEVQSESAENEENTEITEDELAATRIQYDKFLCTIVFGDQRVLTHIDKRKSFFSMEHKEFAAVSSDNVNTSFTFFLAKPVLMGDEIENEKLKAERLPYLRYGDTVRLFTKGADGTGLFLVPEDEYFVCAAGTPPGVLGEFRVCPCEGKAPGDFVCFTDPFMLAFESSVEGEAVDLYVGVDSDAYLTTVAVNGAATFRCALPGHALPSPCDNPVTPSRLDRFSNTFFKVMGQLF